jgi:hypothetical protein
MAGFQRAMSVLLVLAATEVAAGGARAAGTDTTLHADLEQMAHRRIFFAHQSVGANVIDGIRQLATTAGVAVRIAEAPTAAAVGPATLGNTWIGENGKPLGKLQAFEQAMGTQPTGLDVALVKFCYLDITADTDAKALFARYRTTIDSLRARNPGTTFIHVTAPLTDVQRGPKALLKRLLGRAPYGAIENIRREEYNALLRKTYQGREPIFDLARVESTAPDGTPVTVEWNGSTAPAMAPAFTSDGSHLNDAGKLRAARELVSLLAAAPAH